MKVMHTSYTSDDNVRSNESSKMGWAYEVAGLENSNIYNNIVSKFLQKKIHEISSYNMPYRHRFGEGEGGGANKDITLLFL